MAFRGGQVETAECGGRGATKGPVDVAGHAGDRRERGGAGALPRVCAGRGQVVCGERGGHGGIPIYAESEERLTSCVSSVETGAHVTQKEISCYFKMRIVIINAYYE